MRGKLDISGLKRVLARYPKALDAEMRKALEQHGLYFRQKMITDRFTGYTGNRNQGDKLQNRSGQLRRSFGSEVVGGIGQSTPLTLAVFSQGSIYSRLQEYGGVIKPKKAKYLTVPLDDALTPSGVQRYPSARDLFNRYPDQVRVIKVKSGRLFIVSDGKPGSKPPKRKKRQSDLVWLYQLKKSVKVPARLGFRATWYSSDLVADRVQRLNDAVKRASARAGA